MTEAPNPKCLKPNCTRPQLAGKQYCYIHNRAANASFYAAWKRQQKDNGK